MVVHLGILIITSLMMISNLFLVPAIPQVNLERSLSEVLGGNRIDSNCRAVPESSSVQQDEHERRSAQDLTLCLGIALF